MDAKVAGLDAVKMRLAVTLRRHMLAAAFGRPHRPANVLVVGPTGGGKTWLIRHALEAFGALYIELNATQFSEVGFAGRDLSSFPIDFVAPRWVGTGRRRDIWPLAERWGVVVLDEIDKWAYRPSDAGRHVGRALQAELLRITEGETVWARARDSELGTPFSTHHVLWIGVGAFQGLGQIVDPRGDDTAYMRATPQHIAAYGILEELVGRFSTIVALPPLNPDQVHRVLVEHVWPRWVESAADDGFELTADPTALHLIASVCVQRRVGSRGLDALLEQALWPLWDLGRRQGRLVLVPGMLSAA